MSKTVKCEVCISECGLFYLKLKDYDPKKEIKLTKYFVDKYIEMQDDLSKLYCDKNEVGILPF